MMADEFLTIKIDLGEVMKKLEQAKNRHSDQVMFFAPLNENKAEGDKQPVYSNSKVAVWHNKKGV